MLIIGLTGTIASGKSTIAATFERYHFPVFDADRAVHKLLGPHGRAVPEILANFGDCGTVSVGIDRKKLGGQVFGDTQALAALEAILHPQVAAARLRFLARGQMARRRAVVLDVPLLFETGTDDLCDVTIMAFAPMRLIQERALRRPNMTAEKLAHILAKQMPQHDKARLVDEKITTALGRGVMTGQILRLLSKWQLR